MNSLCKGRTRNSTNVNTRKPDLTWNIERDDKIISIQAIKDFYSLIPIMRLFNIERSFFYVKFIVLRYV